jgi:uncharacterized protein YdaU (DUF1376 family)
MAKEKAPAMPFYGREFYQDANVIVMSLEQEGAYHRLCWLCWQEGSIPNDLAKLAAICKHVPLARFKRFIWPALQPCFVERPDGRLIHRKVEEIRGRRRGYLQGCATGGRRSAERRAAKRGKPASSGAGSSSLPLPPHSPSVNEALTGEFQRWIAEYPNPVRTETALQSWISLIDLGEITEETLPEIFAGLRRWKDSAEWAREDGRFIPAPNAFLTGSGKHMGRMWKDHPPASEEAKARSANRRSGDGIDPNAEWVPPWKHD